MAPLYKKLALADSVSQPIEMHVDGFRAALFDSIVEDASGTGIVGLDRGGRLWVARQVGQGCTEPSSILCIVEKGTQFSFSGGGEDNTHDGTWHMDRTIEWRGKASRGGGAVGSWGR